MQCKNFTFSPFSQLLTATPPCGNKKYILLLRFTWGRNIFELIEGEQFTRAISEKHVVASEKRWWNKAETWGWDNAFIKKRKEQKKLTFGKGRNVEMSQGTHSRAAKWFRQSKLLNWMHGRVSYTIGHITALPQPHARLPPPLTTDECKSLWGEVWGRVMGERQLFLRKRCFHLLALKMEGGREPPLETRKEDILHWRPRKGSSSHSCSWMTAPGDWCGVSKSEHCKIINVCYLKRKQKKKKSNEPSLVSDMHQVQVKNVDKASNQSFIPMKK